MLNHKGISLKILAFIIAVGMLIIWIIPLKNRDLKFVFHTMEQDQNYTFELTHEQLGQNGILEFSFDFDGMEMDISKLLIYDDTGLLKIGHLSFDQLYSYIGGLEEAQISIWNRTVHAVAGEDGRIHLYMKEDFWDFCKEMSETRLQERILLFGLYVCLMIFLYLLVSSVKENKNNYRLSNHNPVYEIQRFLKDMKKYYQFMVFAAKADLKAEVANSYLNRLWWLLEPFFSMMVYVIVFGRIMGSSVENYATFVFSALLMWNLFSKTLNYSVKLVRNNKDIVTKVYVPKFILLFSNMILNIYKLLFSAIVLLVMMIIFKVQIGIHIFWILPSYAVMILFSFGAGMILLHYGVYIDDLGYAVGILLNMMMFLSGIFYEIMTGLSSPLNTFMLCLNPVALCIDTMRNALLYNSVENMPILSVWALASFILCWIGVHIVYKNENSYVKIV